MAAPAPHFGTATRSCERNRGAFIALLCAQAWLCAVACTRTPSVDSALRANAAILAENPPSDRSFAFAGGGMEFLDPAKVAETAGHHLMMNIFEGLFVYNRGDGPPVPAMATGREVSADGKIWRIHLRNGITWSDGVPITAADFVWSWQRVLDPKTASRSAQLLWFLKGGKAFNEGADSDPSHVGVRALDALTVEVELENPTPFFDHLLCEMPFVPTPRHAVERFGDQWATPEHIVSNGPFLLDKHENRVVSVLKKNPRYFDAKNVYLEAITLYHTESDQTAFDWYEVGKTQWHGDVALPIDKIPILLHSGRADFHTDPKSCSYYFSIRVDKPPLDNPLVRRAISLAIDKERLALHVLKGGQPVATNAVPDLFQISHGYKIFRGEGFNPQKARELLAEAGYPRGIGLPPIEFIFNTGEGHRVIAEYVQRNLQENLGIRMQLANMEWGTLLKTLLSGNYAIGRSSWCGDYPDPLTFLEVFHSDSKSNYSGYHSAEFDATIAAIKAEPDLQKRNNHVRRGEEILARDLPLLPMYHYTWSYLVKPYVLGYERHMQDAHPLKYIRYANDAELLQMRAGQPLHLPAFAVTPTAVR